jgi:hypothetical protein
VGNKKNRSKYLEMLEKLSDRKMEQSCFFPSAGFIFVRAPINQQAIRLLLIGKSTQQHPGHQKALGIFFYAPAWFSISSLKRRGTRLPLNNFYISLPL